MAYPLFGDLSVYTFHGHLLYPFLWHLVCHPFHIDQKCSIKKFRIEIWTLSFQICCQNQFLTLGSGQTENHSNTSNCLIFSLTTETDRGGVYEKDEQTNRKKLEISLKLIKFIFFLNFIGTRMCYYIWSISVAFSCFCTFLSICFRGTSSVNNNSTQPNLQCKQGQ